MKTYEFVTAKGTAASVIADETTIERKDDWGDVYSSKTETRIVAVVVNGTRCEATRGRVQGMDGANFKFGGKQAFLPVPKNIMDEIFSAPKSSEVSAKLDAELAAFNRYMDNENN